MSLFAYGLFESLSSISCHILSVLISIDILHYIILYFISLVLMYFELSCDI
jgi:hypothetical protein